LPWARCWVIGAGGQRGRGGAGGIWAGDARRGRAGLCRRLTVQGISTEWFERCGRTGVCCRLTVQGICTGWFERHGWTGRRCPLRRAVGGGRGKEGRRVGGRGEGGSGVRHRWVPDSVSNEYGGGS